MFKNIKEKVKNILGIQIDFYSIKHWKKKFKLFFITLCKQTLKFVSKKKKKFFLLKFILKNSKQKKNYLVINKK